MPGILTQMGRTEVSSSSPLQVVVNPTFVTGFSNFGAPNTVRTRSPAVASASGGTPPYTYVWTFDSGDAEIYPNSMFAPSTYFSAYIDTYTTLNSFWICTVTDSTSATADSNPAEVSLSAYDFYKPGGPDVP